MRKALIVMAVVTSLAGAAGAGPAAGAAPPEPPLALGTDPDPVVAYEPVTVTAAGRCAPGATMRITVGHDSVLTDYVMVTPQSQVTVVADDAGAWTAAVPFPVAYPGSWHVTAEPADRAACAFQSTYTTVPVPPGMDLTLSPTTAPEGATVTAEITGTGCPGGIAQWELGPSPLVLASGRAVVAADGTWRSPARFVAEPPFAGLHEVQLSAWCVFGDETDELPVTVTYPDRPRFTIEPSSPTTTTTTTSATTTTTTTVPATTTSTAPRPPHPLLVLLRRIICHLFACR